MGLLDKLFGRMRERAKLREEREREFVVANTAWGKSSAAAEPAVSKAQRKVDREGLQAAFLDQSGRIAYFLDTTTGDVVDDRDGAALQPPRYRRVPPRAGGADAAERRAFIGTLEQNALRDRLSAASDAAAFRSILAEDRKLERAWYIFRNDRASEEAEKWLSADQSALNGLIR